jgi:nicotinamidase-related amidase
MEIIKKYKSCLIIVDMVNGFVREGVLHDENISKIIPRQIELIEEAKEKGSLIIFIKDTHHKDSVEFVRFGNTSHCLEDTEESELVEELKPYEKEGNIVCIRKNSTSFMEAPSFRRLMREQDELEEFDIVGCCTDICVVNGTLGLANYLDEWDRPHKINVWEDAIATYSEDTRGEYVEAAKILMKQQGMELKRK